MCLDHKGRERWSYRLEDTFRFGAGSYGPPWRSSLLTVLDVHGEKRIAWSLAHSVWWPAPILTLNARGERLSTFVSSGLIYQLRTTVRENRSLIVAAGVSNSRAAASLIVLDGDRPIGTTPEEPGSPYECLSCEPGAPVRYLSFPKTELAIAADRPYNLTTAIYETPGSLSIGVLEIKSESPGGENPVLTFFEFDPSFRLRAARWSDSFEPMHRVFEQSGVLRHSAAACPNRTPRAFEYRPTRGLVEIKMGASALVTDAESSKSR